MKLYYSPGACSLSPHIALHEAGLPFEAVLTSTKTKTLPDGTDFYAINRKGYVPVLELDDGTRLTEGAVIVQYIADQAPAKQLAPANGTMERYRLQEWLNFIGSEVHKSFGPIFNSAFPESAKDINRTRLRDRFTWVDSQLEGRSYLMGEQFTVADAYLYTVLRWTQPTGVDISGLDRIAAYMARVGARPAVMAALAAEAPKT